MFRDIQIDIITNFVVVSNVDIKGYIVLSYPVLLRQLAFVYLQAHTLKERNAKQLDNIDQNITFRFPSVFQLKNWNQKSQVTGHSYIIIPKETTLFTKESVKWMNDIGKI